jgi:hypothetical protein
MSDMFTTDMSWLDIGEQDPAPVSKSKSQSSRSKGLWKVTPEHREKMREVQANLSAEVRASKSAKIRQSWLDKPNRLSAEQVQSIADKLRGRTSPRHGFTHSDQARARIGQANTERWHSTDPKWVAWRELQAQRRAERTAQQVTRGKQKKQIRQDYDTEQRIQTHFGNFRSWGHCVAWLQEQGVTNPRCNLRLHRKAYPELYHEVLKRSLYKQIKAKK